MLQVLDQSDMLSAASPTPRTNTPVPLKSTPPAPWAGISGFLRGMIISPELNLDLILQWKCGSSLNSTVLTITWSKVKGSSQMLENQSNVQSEIISDKSKKVELFK